MDKLIASLLDLSRVQNVEMCLTEVNLSEMVSAIAEELKQQNSQRKVEFNITPNIVALGNPDLLKVALTNLVSNAWKYTAQEEYASITFGVLSHNCCDNGSPNNLPKTDHKQLTPLMNSIQVQRSQIYYIQDNGVGFDMCQANQLFKPFQRLNSSKDFKGTGIGLATVKRIIHRHQGKIWATSSLGQGSTFYFTLN